MTSLLMIGALAVLAFISMASSLRGYGGKRSGG
jgi:hypothetical protein